MALAKPAAGLVTSDGLTLDEVCWQSSGGGLCFDADHREHLTTLRFALHDLPFEYFAAFLPEGARITGAFGASGELAMTPGAPASVHLDVTTSRGRIGPARDGGVRGLAFEPGSAALAWNGERLEAALALPLQGRQGGELRAMIWPRAGEPFTAARLDGELRIELEALGFVADLLPDVEASAGSLSMDVAVEGTVGAPRLAGRIALENGTARLRRPGITVEDVRLALVGDGSGEIVVDGAARSGDGMLAATGALRLDGAVPLGRIDVRGGR